MCKNTQKMKQKIQTRIRNNENKNKCETTKIKLNKYKKNETTNDQLGPHSTFM
jgi:hypothetical protein